MSDISYETLINNPYPIDPFNENGQNYEQYKSIFEDLQGGIIKNYGRNYSLYIFIQFDEGKVKEVQEWIRDEIAKNVTSTWKQLCHTKAFKEEIERRTEQRLDSSTYYGELCTNFFLSYSGYKALGLDPKPNHFDIFKKGMRQDWEDSYRLENPPDEYWYNPPEFWDINRGEKKDQNRYQEKDQSSNIHALILLSHDDLEGLRNAANTISSECEMIGKVIICEAGYVLKNDKKMSVGPFGFADGISQPLFLKKDYDKYCKKEDLGQWDPKASLNLVLAKDPFGCQHSYGSFCVFQKLETNHDCFEKKVDELAEKLKESDRERVGALVIGRFKDGTPIALSNEPNQISNSFNYADDRDGINCPLHAHIRKTNPREDDEAEADDRRKSRIFRAGVTYFDDRTLQESANLSKLQRCLSKLDYLNEVSKQTVEKNIKKISGLLLVCFQSDILRQFATLQVTWADEAKFPRVSEGGPEQYLDPVIGHPAFKGKTDYPNDQKWLNKGNGKLIEYRFHKCVKLKGGEYFFAPSISFLKNL